MKITGFSFIRNAVKFDYPIVEAIRSILPICDDFVIALGNSDDGTRELIQSISPEKIKIIETTWDDSLREGGKVLAQETDKAFQAIGEDTDWCFYIQGDEVVHEKYLPAIKAGMQKWLHHPEVDGLLFNYLHFYGAYRYVGVSSRWYKHEIRVIRNNKNIYSYRDAQGFRKNDDQKLKVKPVDAYIYHYGWVKHPVRMQKKVANSTRLYHDDNWIDNKQQETEAFDYADHIDALMHFKQTHPAVMQDRIAESDWPFEYDVFSNRISLKDKFKTMLHKNFNINLNYQNYILLK